MIDEIRVKARCDSMDAARGEVELLLFAAQKIATLEGLGYLSEFKEGIVVTEVFGNEAWNQMASVKGLGLRFEARGAIKFTPENEIGGGVRLFGYKVERNHLDQPLNMMPLPSDQGEDITDKVMVIDRTNTVVHDHVWGGSQLPDMNAIIHEMTTEEILSDLREMSFLRNLAVRPIPNGFWEVRVEVVDDAGATERMLMSSKKSLFDAASDVREQAGRVPMTTDGRRPPMDGE